MTQPNDDMQDRLLDAILDHVPFDGWSETAFRAAITDIGVDQKLARAVCPRGAVGLAIAFHQRGDAIMSERMANDPLPQRYSEKVASGVRFRIEAAQDKEVVRRGATLFALPIYAADGAKLIWGTADAIWNALGDTSDDFNWYSKRATLSGVYSSTVLFWLGDTSEGHQATWDFLDRRIADVMQFEKTKAQLRENKLFSAVMAGPNAVLSRIKAPSASAGAGLPGRWTPTGS